MGHKTTWFRRTCAFVIGAGMFDVILLTDSIFNEVSQGGQLMKSGMIECSVCHSKLVSPNTKAVSRAYDRHRDKISSKQRALNVLLVVGDCFLVGLQVTWINHLELFHHIRQKLDWECHNSSLIHSKRAKYKVFILDMRIWTVSIDFLFIHLDT